MSSVNASTNTDDSAEHALQTETRRSKANAAIDAKTQRSLGQMLRAHFADLVDAPLPDRITALFDELERKQKAVASDSGSVEG